MDFSSGPWKVETNHSGLVIGVSAPSATHDLDFVCEFETGINSKRELNKVNAALISAAPDLYKAACGKDEPDDHIVVPNNLRMAADLLQKYMPDDLKSKVIWIKILNQYADDLMAAILKAHGEQSK
jgi:hypothetical protein